jgi:hypothetical protein
MCFDLTNEQPVEKGFNNKAIQGQSVPRKGYLEVVDLLLFINSYARYY